MTSQIDRIVAALTCYTSFQHLRATALGGSVPTVRPGLSPDHDELRKALILSETPVWPAPCQTELEQISAGMPRLSASQLLARYGFDAQDPTAAIEALYARTWQGGEVLVPILCQVALGELGAYTDATGKRWDRPAALARCLAEVRS